jgi:D-alanyl-D-alanine dipeptidase
VSASALETELEGLPVLVRVEGIQSHLLYSQQGLNGAMSVPYVSSLVLPCLIQAAQTLQRQSTLEKTLELLIWDAYRTPQTQAALYDRYVRELIATDGLTFDAAFVRAREFVAAPTAVFPHGTGGAVDVTLLINGEEAPMGTGFDDFVPQSASDWYRQNSPQTETDQMASNNREMLRAAMQSAGFIGLDSEWWHFEWGTGRWAKSMGLPVVLDTVLPPP